jgi:hypothetical protein
MKLTISVLFEINSMRNVTAFESLHALLRYGLFELYGTDCAGCFWR